MKRFVALLAGGTLLFAAACGDDDKTPDPPTRVTARQITDAADFIGGTDPIGGVGDWYMANDLIELIIDDPSNQNGIAPSGGNLVDIGLLGADNDQLVQFYQIFTPSQDLPVVYETIVASAEGDVATMTLTGQVFGAQGDAGPLPPAVAAGLSVVTVYTLNFGDPKVYVTTTLTNNSGAPLSTPFGVPIFDIILWGTRSAVPFAPYLGRGFNHPQLDVRNPLPAFGAYSFVGGRSDVEPAWSFGIMAPKMKDGLISGVNTEQVSALGLRPVDDGPLPAGGTVVHERILLVGDELTIESVAKQAFAVLADEVPDRFNGPGTLTGTLTGLAPGRDAIIVLVRDTFLGDEPWNATRPAADGSFELTAPAGDYELRVTVGSMPIIEAGPFTITAGQATAAGNIAAPSLATVNYTILSDSQALPARLTFVGVSPTVDPELGPPFSGLVSRNLVYSVDGTGSVAVEPGTYDVYGSRGLEYSLAHQQVVLAAGGTETLSFDLTKIVDTAGMISVDAHVHSGGSFDSSVTTDTRVVTMAAEGVEVTISTDHDQITDYGPSVTNMGLEDVMATIIGVETTGFVPNPDAPRTIGHNNGWPMTPDPLLPRNGAPPDEYAEPGEVYERMRAVAAGTPVIQLNHARASSVGTIGNGYFTNFSFDPTLAIPLTDDGGTNSWLRRTSMLGNDNLTFDCMEVMNGAMWDGVYTHQQNRDDWFSLLKQGFIKTGMANSDTHRVAKENNGFPRNYVAYTSDTPVNLNVETLDAAILNHQVMGTNGPIITLTASGGGATGGIGDTLTYTMGTPTVDLAINVEAAPWIPVEEVRVLLNGDVVCAVDATGVVIQTAAATACPAGLAINPGDPYSTSTADAQRYNGTVSLALAIDSFVIVEAGAKVPVGADLDSDGVLDTWDTNADGIADIDDHDTNNDGTVDGLDELPLPPYNSPPIVDDVVPGMLPWGFTNPIFLDLGGGWTPPGL